ncbi:hypothetical protein V6N12_023207 [Hibiscus sabdariffa]|uniref:Uncharacterized protein n=1 Tax=Hibiscus sabdariffa TaxID=183260 RepID=A0ABR2FXU1_9ROSI
MGSGSLPESAGASTDSLHTLKFGQKIYFQDASAAAAAAGGGGGGTTVETPPPMSGLRRKPRVVGRVVHGGQPPRSVLVHLLNIGTMFLIVMSCHKEVFSFVVWPSNVSSCQAISVCYWLDHDFRTSLCLVVVVTNMFTFDDYDTESSGRSGSFTIDFTTYPRLPRGDAWPTVRPLDHIPRNRNTAPWQNNSENPPGDLFLQDSLVGTGFSGTTISPVECFPGVGDSSCALSLLSNQPWGSRTKAPTLEVNDMMNTEGSSSLAQPPTGPTAHDVVMNPYSQASWGLTRTSDPVNVQHFGRLELPQQNGRQCIELEQQSRSYDTSTLHIHWSL